MNIDTPDSAVVNPDSKPEGLGESELPDTVHNFALGY